MAWGQVVVGGVTFREDIVASQSGDSLKISGQESHPPSTRAAVIAAHHNVLAARGLTLPVVFTDKSNLSGFYLVTDASSELLRHANGRVQAATWSLGLDLIGTDRDVEIESRLPAIARTTELAGITPVFWQAPAPGYTSYYTGATVPSGAVSRTSVDGTLAVQLGIPTGVAPRWTVAADDYLDGAARLYFDNLLRIGADSPALSVWELNNGLVKAVAGNSGAFVVSAWGGVAWESPKTYQITVAGAPLTGTPTLTVIRNEPEQIIIRLSYPVAVGRITVDLGLRRGSRVITGVIKRHSAATLGVTRVEAETASVVTGGLRASAADADGNRFVLGSSRTITTTTSTASISKATQIQFDFFVGHEFGSSPAAGDAFADLLAQYLGSGGSERARIARR